MTIPSMDDEARAIADEIFRSCDGQTEQQRFYAETIEPRCLSAAQLVLWESQHPHINLGEE